MVEIPTQQFVGLKEPQENHKAETDAETVSKIIISGRNNWCLRGRVCYLGWVVFVQIHKDESYMCVLYAAPCGCVCVIIFLVLPCPLCVHVCAHCLLRLHTSVYLGAFCVFVCICAWYYDVNYFWMAAEFFFPTRSCMHAWVCSVCLCVGGRVCVGQRRGDRWPIEFQGQRGHRGLGLSVCLNLCVFVWVIRCGSGWQEAYGSLQAENCVTGRAANTFISTHTEAETHTDTHTNS